VQRTPTDAKPALPESIRRATWVMYAGAAASIAGIFVNLTTLGAIRQRSPLMSPALLSSTEHQAIAEFIVGGLVVAAVWVFMAISCRAGMGWARIAGTVLFAIDTVYTADMVIGFDRVNTTLAGQLYASAVWLIGLTATLLLWQRSASAYFRRAPR
jgi:hypothetical protein